MKLEKRGIPCQFIFDYNQCNSNANCVWCNNGFNCMNSLGKPASSVCPQPSNCNPTQANCYTARFDYSVGWKFDSNPDCNGCIGYYKCGSDCQKAVSSMGTVSNNGKVATNKNNNKNNNNTKGNNSKANTTKQNQNQNQNNTNKNSTANNNGNLNNSINRDINKNKANISATANIKIATSTAQIIASSTPAGEQMYVDSSSNNVQGSATNFSISNNNPSAVKDSLNNTENPSGGIGILPISLSVFFIAIIVMSVIYRKKITEKYNKIFKKKEDLGTNFNYRRFTNMNF